MILGIEDFIRTLATTPESLAALHTQARASGASRLSLDEIEAEIAAVRHRPKFGLATRSVDVLLAEIVQAAVTVHPATPLAVASDEADNRFLECALAAGAAFLVTGNLRHFPVGMFQDIHILEPSRFAQTLAEHLIL